MIFNGFQSIAKEKTMTAKHTEGPWGRNIPPASKYPVIYAGRNTHVAQVISKGLPDAEVEANANLIAAAPDLLAVLEELFEIGTVYSGAIEQADLRTDFVAWAEKAKTIIANAKGEPK
jgi:hypothetical protein